MKAKKPIELREKKRMNLDREKSTNVDQSPNSNDSLFSVAVTESNSPHEND